MPVLRLLWSLLNDSYTNADNTRKRKNSLNKTDKLTRDSACVIYMRTHLRCLSLSYNRSTARHTLNDPHENNLQFVRTFVCKERLHRIHLVSNKTRTKTTDAKLQRSSISYVMSKFQNRRYCKKRAARRLSAVKMRIH